MWVEALASGIGSFFGIGTLALLYEEWQRRRREKIEKSIGFAYRPRPDSSAYFTYNGALTVTRMQVESIAPGVRFDVNALIWIDGKLAQTRKLAGRYTEHDSPLTVDIEVESSPGNYPDVRFGLMWQVSYGDQFEQMFTRTRIGTPLVEEWHWYRFRRFRRWLNESKRAGLWFTGKKRPLGHWKKIAATRPVEWEGPLAGRSSAAPIYDHIPPSPSIESRIVETSTLGSGAD